MESGECMDYQVSCYEIHRDKAGKDDDNDDQTVEKDKTQVDAKSVVTVNYQLAKTRLSSPLCSSRHARQAACAIIVLLRPFAWSTRCSACQMVDGG